MITGVTGSIAGCQLAGSDTETDKRSPPAGSPQSPSTAVSTPDESPTADEDQTREATLAGNPTPATPSDPRPLSVSGRWPSFRHDATNSGVNRTVTAPDDPELYWHLFVQGTSPVVADGRIYMLENTRDERLVSRRAETGRVEWKIPLSGGGVGTAPVVTTDRVFALTYTKAHAVSRESGERLWTKGIGRGSPTAPVATDDGIYFCNGRFSGDLLTAYRVSRDGATEWEKELAGEDCHSVAHGDGAVYVSIRSADDSGRVAALEAGTGEIRWEYELDGRPDAPAVSDGSVYLTASGTLYALATADGTLQWTADGFEAGSGIAASRSPIAVTESSVFVGSPQGIVVVSSDDGTRQWTAPADESAGAPTVAARTLYYGSEDERVRAVDLDSQDVIWRYRTEEKLIGDMLIEGVSWPPVPVDGGLFVIAPRGLLAFGPSTE